MRLYTRNKVYYYDFTVDGKRYRGSTKLTRKKEAEEWVKKFISEKKEVQSASKVMEKVRESLVKKNLKLSKAWEIFVVYPRAKNPGKQQMKSYKMIWDDFIAFLKSKHPSIKYVSQIMSEHAKEYVHHIRTQGRFSKGTVYKRKGRVVENNKQHCKHLSNNTKNAYLGGLKLIFDVLSDDEYVLQNPFSKIKKLPKQTESREVFTPGELKIIGEKSKDTCLYPLFLTGISTGLREGDICNLKWEVIDLNNGWIRGLKTRKTGKKVSLPLLPGLKDYLLTLKKTSSYVFPDLQEKYSNNASGLSANVTEFLEGLGIKSNKAVEGRTRRVSTKDIHSLRHTFAYMSAIHGVPLPIVQSILGHMSPEMTKLYMDHAAGEAKQKFMSQLPNYLHGDEPVNLEVTAIKKLEEIKRIISGKKNLDEYDKKILALL